MGQVSGGGLEVSQQRRRQWFDQFSVDGDTSESLTQFGSPGHLLTAYLPCVAVGGGDGGPHTCRVHVWRSEGSVRELVASFYLRVQRWNSGPRLSSKRLSTSSVISAALLAASLILAGSLGWVERGKGLR